MSGQRGGAGRSQGKPEDVVYTPDWCAKDMIDHFAPTGVVLDPCRGLGAFHDLLPEGSPWCEITDGTDFFDWHAPVDWVIGNPPYSLTRPWFQHSFTIADDICYLVPCRNVFSAYGFLDDIRRYGGIVGLRIYGTGSYLGFPMGNAIGAFHLRRSWTGPTQFTYQQDAPLTLGVSP